LALQPRVKVKPMQPLPDAETEELLRRAGDGDGAARQRLLARHRDRLCRMVDLRLDRRLRARVDPSDVVQEVLTEADRALAEYLARRPLPFYPWLRQLAWERLVALHRRHVTAQRRSVTREEMANLSLANDSVLELADRLIDRHSSPSHRLLREELRARVRVGLDQLGARDREVLILRHLEQLSTAETAAVLGVTEGAVKLRHLRALDRLRSVLEPEFGKEQP
jgi:RNA polymerase sigma-70 factor (ECF subfamily)